MYKNVINSFDVYITLKKIIRENSERKLKNLQEFSGTNTTARQNTFGTALATKTDMTIVPKTLLTFAGFTYATCLGWVKVFSSVPHYKHIKILSAGSTYDKVSCDTMPYQL